MALIDVKKIQSEAEKEIREETEKEAKSKIKSQMAKIAKAKAIVRSLEQELDLIMEAIGNEVL